MEHGHVALHDAEATVYGSVDELARELGISRQAAYAGLRQGTIPAIRLNKRFILPRAAIKEWLKTAGKGEHSTGRDGLSKRETH